MQNKKVIIIGAGPGGYVCAIKLAQFGHQVSVIDAQARPGGTCLNVGCIPSKNLLHVSEHLSWINTKAHEVGVELDSKPLLNFEKIMQQKNAVLDDLGGGIKHLFKKNKIDYIMGSAELLSPTTVKVNEQILEAEIIIIAAGSTVKHLPNLMIDNEYILTSTEALNLTTPPKNLIVIGGGYIGLELGCVWQRFGSTVTILEAGNKIVPQMDEEIGLALQNELIKQGLTFKLNTTVISATIANQQVNLTVELANGTGQPETQTIICDKVLVAVGRQPNSNLVGLPKLGIKLNAFGQIIVDEHFKTNVDSIFAIGDVIAGPMLAHKAEAEGVALAHYLSNQHFAINYHLIPSVIYTNPEVATIGFSEQQLLASNINFKSSSFPFKANSRAKATHTTSGYVKILADASSEVILGVHIIAANAGTMIMQIANVMQKFGKIDDLIEVCYPHPTHNEAIKEAALKLKGQAVHM